MEREILFRGFCPRKNGKQIITLDDGLPFSFCNIRGNWVYGDLIHNIDCVKVRERETDINRIAKSYEVIPETVGQYTGLKDKNGKEIYEGDIIKLCDTNPILFRVETILARYGYKTVFKLLDDGTIAQCYFLDKCEVVGNIYENPELLKERSV